MFYMYICYGISNWLVVMFDSWSNLS